MSKARSPRGPLSRTVGIREWYDAIIASLSGPTSRAGLAFRADLPGRPRFLCRPPRPACVRACRRRHRPLIPYMRYQRRVIIVDMDEGRRAECPSTAAEVTGG